jgi:hypothetical protein
VVVGCSGDWGVFVVGGAACWSPLWVVVSLQLQASPLAKRHSLLKVAIAVYERREVGSTA